SQLPSRKGTGQGGRRGPWLSGRGEVGVRRCDLRLRSPGVLVRSMRDNKILSLREKIFTVLAGFSALYCVAVIFALSLPGAKSRFLIALAVFLASFSLVKHKKGIALGILVFIGLRFAWAGIAFLLQR